MGSLIYYRIKKLIRTKENLFWSLCFPILLGTFFYLGFGNATENSEKFKEIPVALIVQDGVTQDENLTKLLDEVSGDKEDALFTLTKTTESDAKKLLENDKIDGYIIPGEKPSLVVGGSGINESIIQQFLDKYQKIYSSVGNIITENPKLHQDQLKIGQIAQELIADVSHTTDVSLTKGNNDPMVSYFYALIAMTCIYGSFWGIFNAVEIEANISPLGARRCLSPTHKLKVIVADAIAAFIVHMAEIMIVLVYIVKILGINFGDKFGYVILACAMGSIIGIQMGAFLGAVIKGKEQTKVAITLMVSMIFCFFSGLMDNNIKNIMEHSAPILNRINPCTLLVDAFYSLNIYDTYDRYFFNLIILGIMATVLCILSYLVTRREKYASI